MTIAGDISVRAGAGESDTIEMSAAPAAAAAEAAAAAAAADAADAADGRCGGQEGIKRLSHPIGRYDILANCNSTRKSLW